MEPLPKEQNTDWSKEYCFFFPKTLKKGIPEDLERITKCFDGLADFSQGIQLFIFSKDKIKEEGEVFSDVTDEDIEKAQERFLSRMYCANFTWRRGAKTIMVEKCDSGDLYAVYSKGLSQQLKTQSQNLVGSLIKSSNKKFT